MEKRILYTTMPNLDEEREYFEEQREAGETQYEDFWDFLNDELDFLYDDFLSDFQDLVCIARPSDIIITGTHGMWDGSHKIIPEHANTLREAIEKCISGEDDFEISLPENARGLVIETHNHDASSKYTIRFLGRKAASDLEDYEMDDEGNAEFDFDNEENYLELL